MLSLRLVIVLHNCTELHNIVCFSRVVAARLLVLLLCCVCLRVADVHTHVDVCASVVIKQRLRR